MPIDSQLAAAARATKGDSLNATAWENVAHIWQMKGDTLKAIDAFIHELAGEPYNTNLRLGIAELLRQHKQYPRAVQILDEGLARSPGEERFSGVRSRVCIEGELWRCVLDGFTAKVQADGSVLGDSSFLKAAIGAAQALPDTQRFLFFSRAAARHFAKSAAFWKTLGAAYVMTGKPEPSAWAYKNAIALDPNHVASALLVAQAIVEGTAYDTAKARQLQQAKDTAGLQALRTAFALRLDSARTYVGRAAVSPDTALQINAAGILLQGGSKLSQAGGSDHRHALPEHTPPIRHPRTPAGTGGPRPNIPPRAGVWDGG